MATSNVSASNSILKEEFMEKVTMATFRSADIQYPNILKELEAKFLLQVIQM